jgi:hypothetical protein
VNKRSPYSGPMHASTNSSTMHSSGTHGLYRTDLPLQIEAFGRRSQDPAALQSLLNDMDISARVKQGQGLGRPDDPRDRQRIPVQNRIIPERLISGMLASSLSSGAHDRS